MNFACALCDITFQSIQEKRLTRLPHGVQHVSCHFAGRQSKVPIAIVAMLSGNVNHKRADTRGGSREHGCGQKRIE